MDEMSQGGASVCDVLGDGGPVSPCHAWKYGACRCSDSVTVAWSIRSEIPVHATLRVAWERSLDSLVDNETHVLN